jgi:hypothetical protein
LPSVSARRAPTLPLEQPARQVREQVHTAEQVGLAARLQTEVTGAKVGAGPTRLEGQGALPARALGQTVETAAMVVLVWEPGAGLAALAALALEQSVLRAATAVSATARRVGPVVRAAEVLVQTVAPGATAALESDLPAEPAVRPALVRMLTAAMAETVVALLGPRAQPVRSAVLGQVKRVLLGAMVRTSVELAELVELVESALESGEA